MVLVKFVFIVKNKLSIYPKWLSIFQRPKKHLLRIFQNLLNRYGEDVPIARPGLNWCQHRNWISVWDHFRCWHRNVQYQFSNYSTQALFCVELVLNWCWIGVGTGKCPTGLNWCQHFLHLLLSMHLCPWFLIASIAQLVKAPPKKT